MISHGCLPAVLLCLMTVFVRLSSAEWSIDTVDVAINWEGSSVSIAVDQNDVPHIVNGAYPGAKARYAVKSAGQWYIEDVDDYGTGFCASIAVDQSGNPHLAYLQTMTVYPYWLKYAYKNGNQWEYQLVDEMHEGSITEIKIADEGVPHIAYCGANDPWLLKHAWRPTSSWLTEVADPTIGSGNDIDMVLDGAGNPHISHFAAPNYGAGPWEMKYSYRSDSTWSSELLDNTIMNHNVIKSGIALDSYDYPHIAYFTHDWYPSLIYTYWNGQAWVSSVVDQDFGLLEGGACSLVLDQWDSPHIIYGTVYSLYGFDSDLRYAHQNGAGNWLIEVVDSTEDAGELNDLAIDSHGALHAAYIRCTGLGQNGYIMYAKKEPSITVTLTPINPPIQIPATGGSFDFNLAIDNNEVGALSFDIWLQAILPDSSQYPLFGPVNITMPGGGTIDRERTQTVPANAPAGNYTYLAYTGIYPDTIWSSDSFPFVKLAEGEGSAQPEWMNAGEPLNGHLSTDSAGTTQFDFYGVFPNPFNNETKFNFELPQPAAISLQIYDIAGREVAHPAEGWYPAGRHEVAFAATNLPAGMYLYQLRVNDIQREGKVVLIK